MYLRFQLICLFSGIWAQPEYAKFRVLTFLFVLFGFLSVVGVKCWLFSKLNVWEHRESHVCGREGWGKMNGARFRISRFSHSNI